MDLGCLNPKSSYMEVTLVTLQSLSMLSHVSTRDLMLGIGGGGESTWVFSCVPALEEGTLTLW